MAYFSIQVFKGRIRLGDEKSQLCDINLENGNLAPLMHRREACGKQCLHQSSIVFSCIHNLKDLGNTKGCRRTVFKWKWLTGYTHQAHITTEEQNQHFSAGFTKMLNLIFGVKSHYHHSFRFRTLHFLQTKGNCFVHCFVDKNCKDNSDDQDMK